MCDLGGGVVGGGNTSNAAFNFRDKNYICIDISETKPFFFMTI